MSLPCLIQDLIPQKGKMSFRQRLNKAEDDDSESIITISNDNIFLDDNKQLSNSVLIEFINQLNAAVSGYNYKYRNKPAQKGLFVGLQDAAFYKPAYFDNSLTLKTFITEEVAQVTFIKGIIYRDKEKLAELVTKIYKVADMAEFDLLIDPGNAVKGKSGFKSDQQPPSFLFSNLQRKLYTYLDDFKTGADFISFTIACPEDFEAFDGHFPGNPILPGIILLEIANLALQLFMKKPVFLKTIKKMKISSVVLPNQAISCIIKIVKDNDGFFSFSATFKDGAERDVSRFNGTFEGREQ